MIYLQLTHWGRVTHICVSKLTIIGSDNGLSPGRRQAIIWPNAGMLLSGAAGTNFSEHSRKWSWNGLCEMVSISLDLNELNKKTHLKGKMECIFYYLFPIFLRSGFTVHVLNCLDQILINIYIYINILYHFTLIKLLASTCSEAPNILRLRVVKWTSSNGTILSVTCLLWGQSTGQLWILLTKASDAELWCFLWATPEPVGKATIETAGFETPSRSLWRHCHVTHNIRRGVVFLNLKYNTSEIRGQYWYCNIDRPMEWDGTARVDTLCEA